MRRTSSQTAPGGITACIVAGPLLCQYRLINILSSRALYRVNRLRDNLRCLVYRVLDSGVQARCRFNGICQHVETHIVNGAEEVRILGQKHPVRARIEQINGFSAHADQTELLRWISGIDKPVRKLFVTHGESSAAHHFADLLRDRKGWNIDVPGYKHEVLLD